MEKAISLPYVKSNIGIIVFNFVLLSAVYLLPVVSHLLAFPLYYFDPMRFALVFALLHTSKKNTILIALTLPLFSFLISSHPSFVKSGLLTTELLLNVFLYFVLFKKTNSRVISLVISILISKVIYYLLKLITVETGILADSLFSTPFYYQTLTVLIISIYVLVFEYFINKKNNNNS